MIVVLVGVEVGVVLFVGDQVAYVVEEGGSYQCVPGPVGPGQLGTLQRVRRDADPLAVGAVTARLVQGDDAGDPGHLAGSARHER